MKGNQTVKEFLQRAISAELAAINQYILHSEMQENMGYHRLAAITKRNAIGEMKHCEAFIARLLFLDGTPNVSKLDGINVGATVIKQLENDLSAEYAAVSLYNEAVKACVAAGDNGTRELFESTLKDEEAHVDYLEAQLGIIGEVGEPNYLAQHIAE